LRSLKRQLAKVGYRQLHADQHRAELHRALSGQIRPAGTRRGAAPDPGRQTERKTPRSDFGLSQTGRCCADPRCSQALPLVCGRYGRVRL
jgi:hypothetical protein